VETPELTWAQAPWFFRRQIAPPFVGSEAPDPAKRGGPERERLPRRRGSLEDPGSAGGDGLTAAPASDRIDARAQREGLGEPDALCEHEGPVIANPQAGVGSPEAGGARALAAGARLFPAEGAFAQRGLQIGGLRILRAVRRCGVVDAGTVSAGLPGGALDSNAEIREVEGEVNLLVLGEREQRVLRFVEGDLVLVDELREEGERTEVVGVLGDERHGGRELDIRWLAEERSDAVEPGGAVLVEDAHVELTGAEAADGVGVDVGEHLGRVDGRAREQDEDRAREQGAAHGKRG
jgi:hypothetical protein